MTNPTDEVIVYSNSRNGLGIRILGARRATNKSGIYIKQLLDEGLAQRDGRLKVRTVPLSPQFFLFLFLSQVGDQLLTINDETVLGISREHAVNLLRSAAATNEVRVRVRHFSPPFSSAEYQKFLYEEKSTDEEENLPKNNEVKMRKSSRRYPTTSSSAPAESREDLSLAAQHSLLQAKFRLLDLVELLKNSSPRFSDVDQQSESLFLAQLSQSHSGEQISFSLSFDLVSLSSLARRTNLPERLRTTVECSSRRTRSPPSPLSLLVHGATADDRAAGEEDRHV